jgi:predicted transcriptional regulator
MTNAEFYENIRRLAGEKGLTLYQFQKKCDGIPESTFFAIFQKKSTPKARLYSDNQQSFECAAGRIT